MLICHKSCRSQEGPLKQEVAYVTNEMIHEGSILHTESDADILGPETPGVRPLVPRLKRIQESVSNSEDKNGRSLLDSSKRTKVLSVLTAENISRGEVSAVASKFEWLEPSRIRDANGRRPGDVLYDKRTLYIPPDAFRKMSASQKQYWSVKCQYMDVVIFFKVVSQSFEWMMISFLYEPWFLMFGDKSLNYELFIRFLSTDTNKYHMVL